MTLRRPEPAAHITVMSPQQQRRQPAGTPAGGQYAPDTRQEVDVALDDPQIEANPKIARWFEQVRPYASIDAVVPGKALGGNTDWEEFVVGEDDLSVFRQGGCAVWAAAAHRQTGWPIVVAGPSQCDCGDWEPEDPIGYGTTTDQLCPCQPHHLMVQAPDGMVWDVAGEHDPTAFVEDRDTVDPDGNTIPYTIRRIEPETAVDILESWHPPTEAADLGQWAAWSVAQVI